MTPRDPQPYNDCPHGSPMCGRCALRYRMQVAADPPDASGLVGRFHHQMSELGLNRPKVLRIIDASGDKQGGFLPTIETPNRSTGIVFSICH